MEDQRGASAIDTIERPVLPALPPPIHAVRNPGAYGGTIPSAVESTADADVADEVPIEHEDVEVFTPPERLAPPEPPVAVVEAPVEVEVEVESHLAPVPAVDEPITEVVIDDTPGVGAESVAPSRLTEILKKRQKKHREHPQNDDSHAGGSGLGLDNKKLLIALFATFAVVFVVAGVRMTGVLTNTSLVTSLEGGDCIEEFFTPNQGEFREVFLVGTTDCANPHAYEVYAVGESVYTETEYPGIDGVFDIAQSYCDQQYSVFVGGDFLSSPWNVWTFAPTEDRWNAGERDVQCIVGDFDQTSLTTGTLRDAGR